MEAELERYLRVGLATMVQVNPDQRASVRLWSVMRGWQTGSYILLDIPKQQTATLRADQKAALRFLVEGNVCGCTTHIQDLGTGSHFSYTRVAWPHEVSMTQVRKHERVHVEVPCVVETDDEGTVQAEMMDVSAGGCKLRSSKNLDLGTATRLSFTLPDGSSIEGLTATVRGAHALEKGAELGLQFGDDQIFALTNVQVYVTTVLESGRGGEPDEPHIVFIDPEPTSVKAVRNELEALGFRVTVATTVVDGLSLVRVAGPRAVLVNQGQPELDGIGVCRCVKAPPRYRSLPVFVYGGGDKSIEKQVTEAGATSYLPSIEQTDGIVQAIKAAVPPPEKPRAEATEELEALSEDAAPSEDGDEIPIY